MSLALRRRAVLTPIASAPFDPLDAALPSPSHLFWAGDPAWSNPGDGNAVSSWANATGSPAATQATGSAQPTFRASTAAFNNRPTVEFDGGDSLISNVSDLTNPDVLIIVGSAAGVSQRLVGFYGGAGGSQGVGRDSTGKFVVDSSSNITAAWGDDLPHVFAVVVDGGASELWVDGVLAAKGPIGGDNITKIAIGVEGDEAGSNLVGHVAYVGTYDSARTADVVALEAALADHYGITYTTPTFDTADFPWSGDFPVPHHGVWAGDPDWSNPGDGNAVPSWRNKNNTNHITQATGSMQPTFRASTAAFNNRPTVEFDGGDLLYNNVPNDGGSFVWVAVGNLSGVNQRLCSTSDADGGFGRDGSGNWFLKEGGSSITGTAGDADPHLFVWELNTGGSERMFVDGEQVASGGVNPSSLFHLAVGGGSTNGTSVTNPMTGHIAFLGIYRKARAEDVQIQALIAELADHYDINVVTTPEFAWSGAVTDSAAVVKSRIPGRAAATLHLSESPDLSSPTDVAGVLGSDDVWTFTLTGLDADTDYYWTIGGWSKTGHFRTCPTEGQPASFTVAAASCAGNSPRDPGSTSATSNGLSFSKIEDRDPLMFIHMGDLHYRNISTNDPAAFRQAYRDVVANARQGSLYRNVALAYVWDDHDYGANNSGGSSASKPAAQQVYREYVPHYPLPDSDLIYQTFVVGRVRFILLDSRSERAGSSILGTTQKQWLKDELTAATEPVIVLGLIVPWTSGSTSEGWDGYTTERTELSEFFDTAGVADRLVLLHGDIHMLAADDGTNTAFGTATSPGPPLFCFAPLDGSLSTTGTFSEGKFTARKQQYGTLDFADDGTEIVVTGKGWSVASDGTETEHFSLVKVFDAP